MYELYDKRVETVLWFNYIMSSDSQYLWKENYYKMTVNAVAFSMKDVEKCTENLQSTTDFTEFWISHYKNSRKILHFMFCSITSFESKHFYVNKLSFIEYIAHITIYISFFL